MNIHEYQAAEILAKYGIPVNPGKVATTPEEARDIAAELGGVVVVKAQVHTGGRGKAGGVKVVKDPEAAYEAASQILGMDIKGHTVNKVLIAAGADIQKEVYISAVMNRPDRKIMIMASAEGGVEIEVVAEENPDAIITRDGDPLVGFRGFQAKEVAFDLDLDPSLVNVFAAIAERLYQIFMEEDATLVEINPLIINGEGKWQALDAKMSFDDNALYRQPEIEKLRDLEEEDPTEMEAGASGISFVKLDGTIGCIVNGAGLSMATLDAVQLAGGSPANFLDVGGGANEEQVTKAFNLVLADPAVNAILINIFGGITRGDVVARGIVAALNNVDVKVPLVVRLSGTNAEEGKKILAEHGITAGDSMDEAAAQVVAAAGA